MTQTILDSPPIAPRIDPPIRPLMLMGTRPEAIKMAPVVLAARQSPDFDPVVCSTGQHRQMLDQVLGYFDIQPEIDLNLMRPGQTLSGLTGLLVSELDALIRRQSDAAGLDCVVVQGDTTTVMVGAMIAFYHRTPVVHVEAGLRTGDLDAPWPEEFNRRVAGIVASLHCAPTERAAAALRREHVAEHDIRVTGNTVIDALAMSVRRERGNDDQWRRTYPMLAGDGPVVLITGHRRENFGQAMHQVCSAIGDVADQHPDVTFIYPVHLNPNVQAPVQACLGGRANVHLLPPADYPAFVWLMDRSDVVLTDSGGVQEEAPSLRCRVLVTREKTERPEAIEAGLVRLVGTDRERIVRELGDAIAASLHERATRNPQWPSESDRDSTIANNPYGDGHASERILDWMRERFSTRRRQRRPQ